MSTRGLMLAYTTEDIKNLEQQLEDYLLKLALERKIVTSPEDAVIRDILPATDLGLTKEAFEFNITVANDWNKVVDVTLPDKKKIIGFIAIATRDVDPIVTAIRFQVKDTTIKAVVPIEQIYYLDPPQKPLDHILTFLDGENMRIYMYGIKTGTARIILIGKVVEPKGETISKA